jgi:hypothetical protein
MRKSDKKIENLLITSLKGACEDALGVYEGFEWLTHAVNYQKYPDSLLIICMFDTNENLSKTINKDNGDEFKALIAAKLLLGGIQLKDAGKHIKFDTEEALKNRSGNGLGDTHKNIDMF